MHMWRRKLFLCISYKMKYLQNETRKQKSIKEVTQQFSMIFQIRLKNNTVNFRVICYLNFSDRSSLEYLWGDNVYSSLVDASKDIGNKNSLVHLKDLLKLYIRLYYRFFISCLILKIFQLKKWAVRHLGILRICMLCQARGHTSNFYLESKRSIWVQNFVSGCCLKFRND